MTAVKTIDLRGLSSMERESLLFGTLEQVRTGERAQVAVEFDPVPLVYALRAGGEFHVGYLKEGPDEWLLELTRTAQPPEKREQLKELLRILRAGPLSEEGREEARELLLVLDSATLVQLERDLAREGIAQAEVLDRLRELHLAVLATELAAHPFPGVHPVRTLMEEHAAILANLKDLAEVAGLLAACDSFEAARGHLPRLLRGARLLLEAESHHRREEQVIFPLLERAGLREQPAVLREDHELFRRFKQRLGELAERALESQVPDFELWKCEVVDHADRLTRELASHIFKEDNLLYRSALRALSTEDWLRVKRESDAIGYCCFEAVAELGARELDLRGVPLLQRQPRIMAAWGQLPSGGVLRLTNDREPRSMYYLFQATQRGRFDWTDEQQGPEAWVVAIRKR
jgi:uncharacterized protein (DUF2249 family)/hemerythrin-like domain-containing protein